LCKYHLQLCAVLSQGTKHKEALQHGKLASFYGQELIRNTNILCKGYIEKLMSEKLGGVTIDTPKNGNRIKKSGSPTRSGQLQDAASVPIDSILDNDLGSVLLP